MWVKRRVSLFTITLIAFVLCATTAVAQVTTADIIGSVFDNSGGVITNATVTVTNLGTGVKRTMPTNSAGDYAFTLLPIGTYSVSIEAAGFKKFIENHVALTAGDRIRVDSKMQVGEITQTLEVSEQAIALQTDSATVGSSVSSTAVQDLPANGRNFITLVQIGPGINESNQSSLGGGARPDDRRQTSTVSANGQSDSVNNFMLDGMDNNERSIGTVIVKPSIDGLAEVQVETSLYPASVGRAGGAVINEITKSGANKFHGSLFEFLRNDKFDAKNFFNIPQAGNPLAGVKPEFRQNQFGGSAGGPIRKDKLFFFVDYEAFRRIQASTAADLIPTACELGRTACNGITQLGNFSDLTTKQINTPSGIPVPNNIIPLSSINQVSQDYAALYPTLPAAACTGTTCLYRSNPIGTQFADTGDARIDDHISAKDSFFGRYSVNQTSTFNAGNIPPVNVAGMLVQGTGVNFNTTFPGTAQQRQQAVTLGYTRIFSPSLIFQLGGQLSRYVTDSEGLNSGENVNNAFGGPANINGSAFGTDGLALLAFSDGDYVGLGDQFALPTGYFDTTEQYSGSFNWTKGAHSIKFGASVIHRDWSVKQQLFKARYSFEGSSGPGNDFAAMLEGDPYQFTRNMSLTAPQYRANEFGEFIQDDWRATRWLTLNLGLRWDVFTPDHEKHNALSNFDPTNAAMLASGIIQQAGTNSLGASDGFKTQLGDFQPRFGFAATLGHGMVLRGGFGTSYFPTNQASPAYLKNAPITSSATVIYSATNALAGWTAAPSLGADSTCLVASCGATGSKSVPAATAQNYSWAAIYMVNLTLEKEISGNVISAAFVGQYTRNLGRVVPNVDLPLPPLGPGGCGVTTTISLPSPCQPYYSSIPLVTGVQLLESNGTVNYNALEVQFKRSLSKGWSVSSNYTYTSNLTDTGGPGGACTSCGQVVDDWARDYGPNMYMVRHRFTFSSSYSLPVGQNLKGVAGVLAKGWQVNAIYVYSTGIPFVVTDSRNNQNNTASGERMNVVPASSFTQNPSEWFDITQFRQQTFGTAGDEGEDAFFMPPYRHLDLSFFKDFQIKESVRLQFRAEGYNISNTPNFGAPNSAISSYTSSGVPSTAGAFGQITGTNTFAIPRQIQFALKLIF